MYVTFFITIVLVTNILTIQSKFLPLICKRNICKNNDYHKIQEWLIGQYDNVEQAEKDIKKYGTNNDNIISHEAVYTVFTKHHLYNNIIVAAYYFYNPDLLTTTRKISVTIKPFRFRYYEFINTNDINSSNKSNYASIMKLYKPSKEMEIKLQKNNYFFNSKKFPSLKGFDLIENCDIGWKRQKWLLLLFLLF